MAAVTRSRHSSSGATHATCPSSAGAAASAEGTAGAWNSSRLERSGSPSKGRKEAQVPLPQAVRCAATRPRGRPPEQDFRRGPRRGGHHRRQEESWKLSYEISRRGTSSSRSGSTGQGVSRPWTPRRPWSSAGRTGTCEGEHAFEPDWNPII